MMHPHYELIDLLTQQRDDAQEAAQTYHEAWQDAAVYWRDKLSEARTWAIAFKRIARNLLHDDLNYDEEDARKVHGDWSTLPNWLKEGDHPTFSGQAKEDDRS